MSPFAAVLTLVPTPAPSVLCVDEPFDDLWHYQCVVSPRTVANIRASCPNVTTGTQGHKGSPEGSPRSTLPTYPKSPDFKDQSHRKTSSNCSDESESDVSLPSSAELSPGASRSHAEPWYGNANSGSPFELCNTLAPQASGAKAVPVVPEEYDVFSAPELAGCYVSQAERQVLQKVFHAFDENHDGKISIEELGKSFKKVGIVKTENAITELLETMTLKSVGHVDEDEFVLLYVSACNFIDEIDIEESRREADRDLLEAFQLFDMDKNGFISPTELQLVLCSLGFSQAQELDACVKMISRVDVNGDGQVDFDEFKRMLGVQEKPLVMAC